MHKVGGTPNRSARRPRVDLAELEREQRRRWRQQAQAMATQLKERRARVVAYHEAGHAIVAAFLGLVPEQIGLEVATHFDAGAVVTPAILSASRTKRAIVLAVEGVFGAEEAARRSELVPLSQGFDRIH